MSRPAWRDGGKERLWRRLVRDWERSGLTIRDFCAERGLAEHNFHAWRRTLVARDKEKALPPFVPVQVVDASVNGQATGIEIIFPDGIVVRVRAGGDEATLRLVLTVLAKDRTGKERPC
jgi:hypothetical protein